MAISERQFLDAMDGLLRVYHSRTDACIRLTPSDFGRLLHIANRGRSPGGRGATLKVVQAEVRPLPSAPTTNSSK